MRPIEKWPAGCYIINSQEQILATYNNHRNSIEHLIENLGSYCSYCEIFDGNLDVEHIEPKELVLAKAKDWDNFLLACDRCNGTDNKGYKAVDFNIMYFPHLNNTLLIFDYKDGGLISVKTTLTSIQLAKANALMELINLDKYPGNPRFRLISPYLKYGFPLGDKRWEQRRRAWDIAQTKLRDYDNGLITSEGIAGFAIERGYFSIWHTTFINHPEVLNALIQAFPGTATNCFDADGKPKHRNPENTADPI